MTLQHLLNVLVQIGNKVGNYKKKKKVHETHQSSAGRGFQQCGLQCVTDIIMQHCNTFQLWSSAFG
jgi:hypothetical protein